MQHKQSLFFILMVLFFSSLALILINLIPELYNAHFLLFYFYSNATEFFKFDKNETDLFFCTCAELSLMHLHRSGVVAVLSLCKPRLMEHHLRTEHFLPLSIWGSVLCGSTHTPQALLIRR